MDGTIEYNSGTLLGNRDSEVLSQIIWKMLIAQ